MSPAGFRHALTVTASPGGQGGGGEGEGATGRHQAYALTATALPEKTGLSSGPVQCITPRTCNGKGGDKRGRGSQWDGGGGVGGEEAREAI